MSIISKIRQATQTLREAWSVRPPEDLVAEMQRLGTVARVDTYSPATERTPRDVEAQLARGLAEWDAGRAEARREELADYFRGMGNGEPEAPDHDQRMAEWYAAMDGTQPDMERARWAISSPDATTADRQAAWQYLAAHGGTGQAEHETAWPLDRAAEIDMEQREFREQQAEYFGQAPYAGARTQPVEAWTPEGRAALQESLARIEADDELAQPAEDAFADYWGGSGPDFEEASREADRERARSVAEIRADYNAGRLSYSEMEHEEEAREDKVGTQAYWDEIEAAPALELSGEDADRIERQMEADEYAAAQDDGRELTDAELEHAERVARGEFDGPQAGSPEHEAEELADYHPDEPDHDAEPELPPGQVCDFRVVPEPGEEAEKAPRTVADIRADYHEYRIDRHEVDRQETLRRSQLSDAEFAAEVEAAGPVYWSNTDANAIEAEQEAREAGPDHETGHPDAGQQDGFMSAPVIDDEGGWLGKSHAEKVSAVQAAARQAGDEITAHQATEAVELDSQRRISEQYQRDIDTGQKILDSGRGGGISYWGSAMSQPPELDREAGQ